MNPQRNRAVVVVLDEKLTEVEAAMLRNGLLMFGGVQRVIPVRSVPNDSQAATLMAKDETRQALQRTERERDECAARLEQITAIVSGTDDDLRYTS